MVVIKQHFKKSCSKRSFLLSRTIQYIEGCITHSDPLIQMFEIQKIPYIED